MAMFQEINLTAEVSDPEGVRAVRLFYRKRGTSEYKMLPFERKAGNERKGLYVRALPRLEIGAEGLEYYLVAENAAGRETFKGAADHPLMMEGISYRASEIGWRFVALKNAWEERDLAKVKRLADLSPAQENFLRQLFDTYRSIDVDVKIDEAAPAEERASALFTIKALVDQDGNAVIPGAEWARARVELSSLRDDPARWRLIWK